MRCVTRLLLFACVPISYRANAQGPKRLPERVIVSVAQRRAAGQPVPSGASLARMKDAGVSESTLLELLSRGLSDTDAARVVFEKKHGWKDEQVLHDFPPKP